MSANDAGVAGLSLAATALLAGFSVLAAVLPADGVLAVVFGAVGTLSAAATA